MQFDCKPQDHPDLLPRLIVLRLGARVTDDGDGFVLHALQSLAAIRVEGRGFCLGGASVSEAWSTLSWVLPR